jgi:predicted DNA-binding transcriptional regulator AlpA
MPDDACRVIADRGTTMTAETARFLDEAAAAQLLNVSPRTLQRWRSTGDGPPYVRAGVRRVLYDAAAVNGWAASRTFAHRAAELASAA